MFPIALQFNHKNAPAPISAQPDPGIRFWEGVFDSGGPICHMGNRVVVSAWTKADARKKLVDLCQANNFWTQRRVREVPYGTVNGLLAQNALYREGLNK